MNNLLYLIPFALVLAMFTGMTWVVLKVNRWKALPTESTFQPHNTPCPHCQHETFTEVGEWGKASVERTFICASCKKKVYRNEL